MSRKEVPRAGRLKAALAVNENGPRQIMYLTVGPGLKILVSIPAHSSALLVTRAHSSALY